MGRIWRVSSAAGPPRVEPEPWREHQPAKEHQLISQNAWRRDTIFRLFCEKADPDVGKHFIQPAYAQAVDAASKSVVLGAMAALGCLDQSPLSEALRSPFANVRERALWLVAPDRAAVSRFFAHGTIPAEDPNPRVRLACAVALGARDAERTFLSQDSRALPALIEIAIRDCDDRWTRAAVLGAITGHEGDFLKALVDRKPETGGGLLSLMTELGRVIAKACPVNQRSTLASQIHGVIATTDFVCRAALFTGFLSEAKVPELLDEEPFREMFTSAARIAMSAMPDDTHRSIGISLLSRAPAPIALAPLLAVLDTASSDSLRIESLRALCALRTDEALAGLLARWITFAPALREAALSGLLATPSGTRALLTAIQAGSLVPGGVDNTRRLTLRKHSDPSIRELAGKLFGDGTLPNASAAFQNAKAALDVKPYARNGRDVFNRSCATCHRLDQVGYAVGPDLLDIRNQPKESILLHITVPDHEVAPGFAAYLVETRDGRTLLGILASETGESIRLRQPLGVEETILRRDIATLTATDTSLMPSGLETAMSRQELADLLAYLRGEK